LITQTLLVHRFVKFFGTKRAFTYALLFMSVSLVLMFVSYTLIFFILAAIILGVSNSSVQTLIPTIISREADAKSQGSIMGLNASYQSIGMIFGPILGGTIASIWIPLPLLTGAFLALLCCFLSRGILKPGVKKESAF
jgi:DHA1 family multidrug resistance protein-like MFS transporter